MEIIERASQSLLNQVSDSYWKGSAGNRCGSTCIRNPFLIRSVIPTDLMVIESTEQIDNSQSLLNQVSDSYRSGNSY